MLIRHEDVKPLDFGGLRIRDYTATLELGASLATIEVPVGATHARSWSTRSDKIYLLTHGELRFWLGDEEIELRAGDALVVPRQQPFHYANLGAQPVLLTLVHAPSFVLDAEVFESDRERDASF